MKKNKKSFEEAVKATPDVSSGYKKGLTALGKYSKMIQVSDNKSLEGSLDIDVCTEKLYPNHHRWDYAFAYKGEVFFVEVHSAHTKEVEVVMNKLQWLKDWLNHSAPEINNLKATSKPAFYWIQSNGCHILKNSPQYRRAITSKLFPISKLEL
jgi:hypothetical protein